MKIYDITHSLRADMPIYPGNPTFSIKKISTIEDNGSNVSELTMGSHTGTHIDAPFHFLSDGKTIDELDTERFLGKCQVLDFTDSLECVTEKDLRGKKIYADILLLKTKNSLVRFDKFHEDFIYLSEDGARYIKSLGAKFVGVDGLSVKKFHEKDFVHKFFLSSDILIAEGLDLEEVSEGEYFFVGLPLKIEGADASPARIILVEGNINNG